MAADRGAGEEGPGAVTGDGEEPDGFVGTVRAIVVGSNDTRLRAAYRVLLAWPVLWFLAGSIGVAVGTLVVPDGATKATNMASFGLLQGAAFAVALVVWARFLDRRRIANYGLSAGASWLADLLVGFGAVLAGTAVWVGVGSAMGWTVVEPSLSAPRDPLVLGLAGVFVGVLVNVWVQQTVFVGVLVKNGSEGLSSRGIDPTRAVLGAWVVATLLFAIKHRPSAALRAVNLLFVLGVYGLLYVHTGELALPIGVHAGVNYAGHTLVGSPSFAAAGPSILQVTNTLSGIPGSLSGGAVPQVAAAYLLLLGWIRWRRGELSVETGIARWIARA